MTDTDRLNEYFHKRAAAITVEAPEPSTIASRAGRRRRSRRTAGAVAAAVVMLAGAIAVFGGGSGTKELNTAGSTISREALEWTSVDVPNGLGWNDATVSASDGSVYGLSTAPGPADESASFAKRTLYRSTDGRTWEERSLPADLSASALAASDGSLYAVGTAPGGGGVDLVVASSDDGAGTWDEVRLPSPAAALKAQFPNEVSLSPPMITTGPEGLVAAVTVTAQPDVAARLGLSPEQTTAGWESTTEGVNLYEPLDPASCPSWGAPVAPTTTMPDGSVTTESTVTIPATIDEQAAAGRLKRCEGQDRTVAQSYTWAQLGIDPAMQAVIGGQVHVYRSVDGAAFDEVDAAGIPAGYASALIGAEDGYRLLVADRLGSNLQPLWSADGGAWTPSGPDIDGYVQSTGLLGDRPAVVIGTAGGATLLTGTGGGGWSAAEIPSSGTPQTEGGPAVGGVYSSAVGPLGFAGVSSDGSSSGSTVIESADGHDFTSHDLKELAGPGDWSVAGITMNADAVIVRLLPAASGTQPGPKPGPQRLLVGTPR